MPVTVPTFFDFATPEKLAEIYEKYVAERGIIGRDGTHPETLRAGLEDLTVGLSSGMRDGSHRFTSYRQELILKGPSRFPRQISIPTARDQIVIKALSLYLGLVFEDARLEVAQWKVSRLVKSLRSSQYDHYVRVDIENFYPSIPHENLLTTLRWKVHDESVISLVRAICQTATVPGKAAKPDEPEIVGVPQGLSVSNILAEILMLPVDRSMQAMSDIIYFRYVDDVLILCPKREAPRVSRSIRKYLDIAGVKAHPEKQGTKSESDAISRGFEYLGYSFEDDKVSVRPSSVSRLEHAISRVFTKYRYALKGKPRGGVPKEQWPARCEAVCLWRLNLLITGCVFDKKRHGWLQYFSQTDDRRLMKRLDAQVDKHVGTFGLSREFKPKTFMRALWAIQHPNHQRVGYVPNFDKMSIDEKRSLVTDIYLISESDVRHWSDERVESFFFKWINRLTSELDKDHDPKS